MSLAANERSAEFYSAVPQNCILREAQSLQPAEDVERPAECNSAIQQSATLRYELGGSVLLHGLR